MEILHPTMSATPTIPSSAAALYLPIKHIGGGKDGSIYLAVRKYQPTVRVALKIISGDAFGVMKANILSDLKAMQTKNIDTHPIAHILDYPPTLSWVSMNVVTGCSVEQLLDSIYKVDGFPPSLFCHVLKEVVGAQLYLGHQEHPLCHMDLSQGGNIMLRPSSGHFLRVTLVDFGAIKPWSEERALFTTVKLARKMTGKRDRVPTQYRRKAGFDAEALRDADAVYEGIETCWKAMHEYWLLDLWEEIEEKVERARVGLVDKEEAGVWNSVLGREVFGEEEVESLTRGGGLVMEEVPFM
jgi:hypothetical protein